MYINKYIMTVDFFSSGFSKYREMLYSLKIDVTQVLFACNKAILLLPFAHNIAVCDIFGLACE